MTVVRRDAPAKLNLTLEVIGRRDDGYHEIRSVVSTISLCDQLLVEDGRGFLVTADEGYDGAGLPSGPNEWNTVEAALALMVEERARLRGEEPPLARIEALRRGLAEVGLRLRKRIPASAGLGGGSSDGTAALLALNQFWGLGLTNARLAVLAAQIGSDCPFFVSGAVQHLRGRGDLLEPLPAPEPLWICIVKPAISRPRKTAYLYSLLEACDYSSGERSDRLAQRLRANAPLRLVPDDLCNVFDRVVDRAFGDLTGLRAALAASGATTVQLCGSGPSICGCFGSDSLARQAQAALTEQGYDAWAARLPAE